MPSIFPTSSEVVRSYYAYNFGDEYRNLVTTRDALVPFGVSSSSIPVESGFGELSLTGFPDSVTAFILDYQLITLRLPGEVNAITWIGWSKARVPQSSEIFPSSGERQLATDTDTKVVITSADQGYNCVEKTLTDFAKDQLSEGIADYVLCRLLDYRKLGCKHDISNKIFSAFKQAPAKILEHCIEPECFIKAAEWCSLGFQNKDGSFEWSGILFRDCFVKLSAACVAVEISVKIALKIGKPWNPKLDAEL